VEENQKNAKAGKSLIIIGFIIITIIFLMYARYENPEITPDALPSIERIALGFYVIMIMSLGLISFGLYRYHKQKVQENGKDWLSIIAITTWNNKSRKIFITTFIVYGIFFSLTSGTLVYQPEVVFSYHYGVAVPSVSLIPCCGEPGYMPSILVYITEHVGLQVIPINLILQIVVSYLVGFNMSIAVSAISISKKGKGLSGVGATTGLFIACPTCVGSFFSLFVGTASGIALTIAITQLQTLFIAISIPVLIAAPIILAKKLRKSDGSCAVEPMK